MHTNAPMVMQNKQGPFCKYAKKGKLELVRLRETDITQCQDDDGLVDWAVPVFTTFTFYWHNVVMPKKEEDPGIFGVPPQGCLSSTKPD